MLDIWAFLLQTLTASGVAVLLLVIKALFKDKLPPRWQFAVWGVMGIMIFLPAGWNGRYTLFHWQFVVEGIKAWVGDYSFTRVVFPIPLLTDLPKTVPQWIFFGYFSGVMLHVIRYMASYIRLRLVLRNGIPLSGEQASHIQRIAVSQKVKIGCVTAVPGLPSAFVCGMLSPVLVIPADSDIDDKVILHEILHMKYKDTLWSAVICFLRCLHWCNPLIIYCANQALNDIEARCDQHVLEQLEGEERREYGRILLSMTNDRFAKTPGSTCINNGGKHIRARIEAIARFKKYPVGMQSVSVCAILLLTLSLVVGVQSSAVYKWSGDSMWLPLASARSTTCTTAAGAFDTYAKAVLDQNGFYRVMCAPESMQKEIIDEIKEKRMTGSFPSWNSGLNEYPDLQSGYRIYNLKQCGKNAYEGLLVVKGNDPSDGQNEEGNMNLAVQNLRVEKENGRWGVVALEDFRNVETAAQSLDWGCLELPGIVYSGTHSNFRIDAIVQTIYMVKSTGLTDDSIFFFDSELPYFDITPKPNAEFTWAARTQSEILTHLGTAEEREEIEILGLSISPVYAGEKRPENLTVPTGDDAGGSSSTGESWSSRRVKTEWEPVIVFGGGGGTFDSDRDSVLPEYYAADLYVNRECVGQFELQLLEGGME